MYKAVVKTLVVSRFTKENLDFLIKENFVNTKLVLCKFKFLTH